MSWPTRVPSVVSLPARTAAHLARAAGLAVGLALASTAAHAQPFSSLTFFGDSYIDTGNAFRFSFGAQPSTSQYSPSAPGRFSNGLVFTDYLAQTLGRPGDASAVVPLFLPPPPLGLPVPASGNFAFGGARTDNLQGTATQIGLYLNRSNAAPGAVTDPTGLYTLFVGGNDLRDISGIADSVARQAAAVQAALNVLAQADTLVGAGARNVLLFTLQSPGVLPEAQATPGLADVRDQVTDTFNSTLAAGIAGLQATAPVGTTFFNFRLDNFFRNIQIDARQGGARYGLTNTSAPCLPAFGGPDAPSCDVSVFADAIHPTTRTHQLLGASIARYVTTGRNVAVVPEPATVALVGGGLVLLGGVVRRRRRGGAPAAGQAARRQSNTFPRPSSPCGSRACLSARMASSCTAPSCSGSHRRFSLPIPCSAATVPPMASTARSVASTASSTRASSAASRATKCVCGCPLPAWPNTAATSTPCARATSAATPNASARRGYGTAQSVLTLRPPAAR